MTRDILNKEMGDGNSKSERHLKWTHNRLWILLGWTWVIIAQFALLPANYDSQYEPITSSGFIT